MKFGDNLKYLRRINNLSQEKLAEKLGVSRQSVSKWECSDAYPEMKHIMDLCDLFHCKINDLVHTSMSDIDAFDKDVQQSVVKFKKDKQIKMKFFSKSINLFSKFWKLSSIFVTFICIILGFVIPIVASSNNTDFIVSMSKELPILLTMKTNTIIIILELFIFINMLSCIFHFLMAFHLEKLSNNFYKENTPFIYKNLEHVKKTIKYLFLILLFNIIGDTATESLRIGDFSLSYSIIDIAIFIIAYLFIHIFEYGYEIQIDSSSVMYGDIDDNDTDTSRFLSVFRFIISKCIQYKYLILAVLVISGLIIGNRHMHISKYGEWEGKTFLHIQNQFMINSPKGDWIDLESYDLTREMTFVYVDSYNSIVKTWDNEYACLSYWKYFDESGQPLLLTVIETNSSFPVEMAETAITTQEIINDGIYIRYNQPAVEETSTFVLTIESDTKKVTVELPSFSLDSLYPVLEYIWNDFQ
ncbi:MAG: helix-turn-helix transcriptional regulator [Erysipelotrichaceae bacterium]|nr:helix-turn-helix transcriptional regulator [Erysipelotrichaceae bacterium]